MAAKGLAISVGVSGIGGRGIEGGGRSVSLSMGGQREIATSPSVPMAHGTRRGFDVAGTPFIPNVQQGLRLSSGSRIAFPERRFPIPPENEERKRRRRILFRGMGNVL